MKRSQGYVVSVRGLDLRPQLDRRRRGRASRHGGAAGVALREARPASPPGKPARQALGPDGATEGVAREAEAGP